MNSAHKSSTEMAQAPTRPVVLVLGNLEDDDWRVIDSLVESASEPPRPENRPMVAQAPEPTVPVQTRMLTGTMAVASDWAPVLLLPSDPYRESVQIWAASDTATDYIRVADDPGKLQSSRGTALVYSAMQTMPFTHTGPVWASCPDATGPVTISFLAVTR